MNFPKFDVKPHNAHYEGQLPENEIRWLAECSTDKAKNIGSLLSNRVREISSVLEVGCGTGAVLLALKNAKIGSTFQGIDYSDPHSHTDPKVLSEEIQLARYDGRVLPFEDREFDFVYSTHVLEHVPDERGFLSELARVSKKYVYIEVPCELNFRATVSALQATLDIGHINAYTPESFALKLATAGLNIVDFRVFDHSFKVHSFNISPSKARAKMIIRRIALKVNRTWATRLFTYHCGALCEVK